MEYYMINKKGVVKTPDSVKTIDEDAFYQCAGVTEVSIPGSV